MKGQGKERRERGNESKRDWERKRWEKKNDGYRGGETKREEEGEDRKKR